LVRPAGEATQPSASSTGERSIRAVRRPAAAQRRAFSPNSVCFLIQSMSGERLRKSVTLS
jgi:hypothetical protein